MDKINFGIKRFESDKDKDFVTALMIYNDSIPADTKTRTNEIVYFANNCTIQPNREMYFFGLYVNNSIIGFIEAGYLKITKTIIIDYFVLKEEYHLNSVFYPLFNLFLQYFSDKMIDYSYIVTEVSTKTPEESVDTESFFTKKMLQMEDFRIVKALYLQPKLGYQNEESNFEFQLMIKSSQPLSALKKATYLNIVRDIFYEHYLTWYNIVDLDNANLYKSHIQEQYNLIEKKLEDSNVLELITQTPVCDYYKASDCHYRYSTSGIVPKSKTTNRPLLLLWIPVILIISFVLSWIIYKVLVAYAILPSLFVSILVPVVTICTSAFTIAFTRISKQ